VLRRFCRLAWVPVVVMVVVAAPPHWLSLDERLDSGSRTSRSSRSPSATNFSIRERFSSNEPYVSGDYNHRLTLARIFPLGRDRIGLDLTFCRSYLTTEDGPVQQSVSNGLIINGSSHC